MSLMLPLVWICSFLLSLSLWGVGALLLDSERAVSRMAAGWCAFLAVSCVAWFGQIPGDWFRPAMLLLFWLGFCGLWRKGSWRVGLAAFLCSGLISLVYVFPYLIEPKLLAYGSYGTDMWGYVNAAEWLRGHGTASLPLPGHPMRYNWTWHVLQIQERPLCYVSLSCLGSALFLDPVQAYVFYPAVLMSSVAMALVLSPGVFGLRSAWWLLLPVVLVIVHPLVYLHFAAQYFGGALVSGFVTLALLVLASPHDPSERREAQSLVMLLTLLCAGLYSRQFVLVAAALGGVPLLWTLSESWRQERRTGRPAAPVRPVVIGMWILTVLVALGVYLFTREEGSVFGRYDRTGHVFGQILTIFGGVSPFGWFGYQEQERWEVDPGVNLVGFLMAVLVVAFFFWQGWRRWKASRDVALPVLLVVVCGCLYMGIQSHDMLGRLLPVFGPGLLAAVAVASQGLVRRRLAGLCLVVCCLPILRSFDEVYELMHTPYITWREDSSLQGDGDDWTMLAYLYYNEDRLGCPWRQYPRCFKDMIQFLPDVPRLRIQAEWRVGAGKGH